MSVTINFIDQANENPFVDSLITQSNAGSSSVTSGGVLQMNSNSTSNLLVYSGTASNVQSLSTTLSWRTGNTDFWTGGSTFDLRVLYQDANNYVSAFGENNGTNSKRIILRRRIAGSNTDVFYIQNQLDTYLANLDALELSVTWSGANATFSLKKNGVEVNTPLTYNSFALTSGVPAYLLQRNGFDRSSQLTVWSITGEAAGGASIPVIQNHRLRH